MLILLTFCGEQKGHIIKCVLENILASELCIYVNVSEDSLRKIVWIQGLVTKERKNLDPMAAPFAKDPGAIDGLREGASLVEVVNLKGLHLSTLYCRK